jgi:ESCRT-I complex subunit TSG101
LYQNAAATSANVQSASTFEPSLPAGFIPAPVTSLLDEDTPVVLPVHQAPPRPPNPELLQLHSRLHDKIKSELNSLSQALLSDAERLRALQTDLLDGEPAIRDEMGRLEAVRDVCRTVGGRLVDTVSRADKNVAELRRRGDPDIDEMVCATTIVHNQLINLVAEDNAIEDTIYQLHRALNAGRIDLDRFLRTTRVLAEEQFMKRALIEKITIAMPTNQSGGTGWS